MKRLFATILLVCLVFGHSVAQGRMYVVDCNGAGDFETIQACFDALPSKSAEWRTVQIRPGLYREKLTLDDLRLLYLFGAGR